ncbi:hypothetical protein GAN75_07050 [Bacteroides thetaiotaomicron]|uniref:Type I restriction modification DNA specificity domain-containing protein n=1 Tax=Bacteroides thetaiotaomicron TaxID=818 RepID=A0A7J5K0M7_BACT4|nr:hypothetical protein GAN75_07050 [Bacteroides thetaiotaomicron]
MEERKEYRIGELYNVQNGLSKGGEFFGTGYPFVSFKTVFNNYFLPVSILDLAETSEVDRIKYSVKRGDILITRTSETAEELGMSCVALSDMPNATYNGFCKRLRPCHNDIVLPEYIGYLFRSKAIRSIFNSLSSMTTRASLRNDDLLGIKLSLPTINEQKKVASILRTIDTKIELNRRINDNLEQQAQALFKSWFVENASYSGVSISEYFLPNRGKNLLVSDAKGGKTPVVAGGLTPSAFHNVANTKAPVITISASGANAGFVNLWGIPVWAADSSYIDSTIVSNIYFWYNLLKYNQKNIYESQTGSAQPHIYPKHIGNLLIPDLDMRKVECYESIVASMYLQINEIQQETKFLSDLRDTLLPKLISGELKINDLNC